MLGFLSEYWLLILVCAIFIAAVVILARKGYKKEARAIALSLVAAAEERYGGGTGEIKYSAVAAALYSRLPYAARLLIDEKTISSIIEEAVRKLKKYLSEEEKVSDK